MNREIKFRGQRVDNRELVTGDLCKSISGAPCIMPTAFFATREFEEREDNEPQVISDSLAIGGFYPVKPETVGQYTGKTTKNNQEIYENDVLQSPSGGLWIVKWSTLNDGWKCYQWKYEDFTGEKIWSIDDSSYPLGHYLSGLLTYDYKVVGNIFDYKTES